MLNRLPKWLKPGNDQPVVDSLLGQIEPGASLELRVDWLCKVFQWLRHERGQSVNTRVKFLLMILQRNPEQEQNVARTLRSIIHQIHALDLFVATGIAADGKFLAELVRRSVGHLVPAPPRYHDFAEIFHLLFPDASSAHWIMDLNAASIEGLTSLLHMGEAADEARWNSLHFDMREAVMYLAKEIQVQSFNPQIRRRVGHSHIVDLACYSLDQVVRDVLEVIDGPLTADRVKALHDLDSVREASLAQVRNAYDHLDQNGVSIDVVYKLERIQAQWARLNDLVTILSNQPQASVTLQSLLYDLALLEQSSQSVRSLWRENLAMLSKKIVEHNAETGSHYISYLKHEYVALFKAALGGGLLTGFTVVAKFYFEHWDISYFGKGLLFSLNYALSFVLIQLLGFTLATKQPAMTATTLAQKIRDSVASKDYGALVTEVRHLFRSQMVAIAGNVLAVIPAVFVLFLILRQIGVHEVISATQAATYLQAHSIWGLTPLLAAFTGVLLFTSSICAGWLNNWYVYRELDAALKHHKTLEGIFGRARMERSVNWLTPRVAGLASNITLGFLLGMTPKVLAFFGILLDVRHVTLSTGVVGFAAITLGQSLSWKLLGMAILGLCAAGVCNVLTSFALALSVANRSQRLRPAQVRALYRRLFSMIWSGPRQKP